MNEIIEKEEILIEDMIYEVRGVQVMLDSDIAKLYQVETKRVNEAVKNNLEKFPERFSFVITNKEIADELNKQNLNVDKKQIVLKDPIKNAGEYLIEAKLFTGVSAKFKVIVKTI